MAPRYIWRHGAWGGVCRKEMVGEAALEEVVAAAVAAA
jgi:hypothetical protein